MPSVDISFPSGQDKPEQYLRFHPSLSLWYNRNPLCAMLELGRYRSSLAMILLTNRTTWEAAAGITLIAGLTAGAVLYLRRKKPTEEELERARRKMLSQSGRLVDGMLLDIREMAVDDGRPLTMLEYSYRSAGVDYECSQDVTTLLTVVDPTEVRAGFPCTVRYQPGNPQNSIVLAESWSGLRSSLPVYPAPKRPDLGKLSPDRG